jgi:hypothetical protein
MSLPRFETTHVLGRLSRGGSSSPVVVETPGGRFVAKLRGAGGGVPALIAELVVAEVAERLGLPVPERALIDLDAEFQSDDRNDELADLLARSVGLNVGFRWLEGARSPRPEEFARFDEDFVARVLWLDGLTLNPDRTLANPNILVWHRQPWLIDHGAALAFHYDWRQVTEASPREPLIYAGHVFAERTGLLPRVDALLAKGFDPHALAALLRAVPDELLASATPETPMRARAAYEAFLWKRLKPPRPFVPAPETTPLP